MLLILALTLATAAPIVSALPLPLSHAESTTVRSLTGPRKLSNLAPFPLHPRLTIFSSSQAPSSALGQSTHSPPPRKPPTA